MRLFNWIFGKRKAATLLVASKPGVGTIAIRPDAKMLRDAADDADEVSRLLRTRLEASIFFAHERVPELVKRLRDSTELFQRVNIDAVIRGNDVLSVREKRDLGLNTRMKYSREFIAYFRIGVLPNIEPKSVLLEIVESVSHEVSLRRSLRRYRESKVVRTVRIFPLGDPVPCAAVRKLKRAFPLDDVPGLPLAGCDSSRCRCSYDAN